MKKLLVAASALALSAGMAFADDTNPKGAGGAAVSQTAHEAKEAGTNIGQGAKEMGVTGKEAGAAISDLNRESNAPGN